MILEGLIQSPRPCNELKQRLKLSGTLKAVSFGLAPESVFREYVRETEKDGLFKRLAYPENLREKVIRFIPFWNAGCARFVSLSDRPALKDFYQADVEVLLDQDPRVEDIIRRIGQDSFCAHFLNNDGPMDRASLARACAVSPEEVDRLVGWINEFFVSCHFSEPAAASSTPGNVRVATFEKDVEGWKVSYFSPLMARGRYQIDHVRLKSLRDAGMLKVSEKTLKGLLRRLECINERKTGLDLVLQWFALRQKAYLDSGDEEDLLPLEQKLLAAEIGRDRSTVCRTLQGRSVLLPWGEEKPLRKLFMTRKEQRQRAWSRSGNSWKDSDEAMRDVFLQRFGVRLSRRSLAVYRRELGLPSSRSRA